MPFHGLPQSVACGPQLADAFAEVQREQKVMGSDGFLMVCVQYCSTWFNILKQISLKRFRPVQVCAGLADGYSTAGLGWMVAGAVIPDPVSSDALSCPILGLPRPWLLWVLLANIGVNLI